jgi:hypothetical protein
MIHVVLQMCSHKLLLDCLHYLPPCSLRCYKTYSMTQFATIVVYFGIFAWRWIDFLALTQYHCDIITWDSFSFLLDISCIKYAVMYSIVRPFIDMISKWWSKIYMKMTNSQTKLCQYHHFSHVPTSMQFNTQMPSSCWRGLTSHHFLASYT